MSPEALSAVAAMALLGLVLGAVPALLRRRLEATGQAREVSLIDAIDALLPQIQCAQCGHPGCRPYAEAIAAGAPVDRCPPGGPETAQRLADLLGTAAPGMAVPAAVVALIDEPRCIGCALCVPACPVDAIVGAPTFMHTVLAQACTGCELCVPACPVDCIDLVAQPELEPWVWPRPS